MTGQLFKDTLETYCACTTVWGAVGKAALCRLVFRRLTISLIISCSSACNVRMRGTFAPHLLRGVFSSMAPSGAVDDASAADLWGVLEERSTLPTGRRNITREEQRSAVRTWTAERLLLAVGVSRSATKTTTALLECACGPMVGYSLMLVRSLRFSVTVVARRRCETLWCINHVEDSNLSCVGGQSGGGADTTEPQTRRDFSTSFPGSVLLSSSPFPLAMASEDSSVKNPSRWAEDPAR